MCKKKIKVKDKYYEKRQKNYHDGMDNGASLSRPSLSTRLRDLPVELIVHIASYCNMKDQRSISYCSKNLRDTMKRAKLIRYNLTEDSCIKYMNDLTFRAVVNSNGRVWECRLSGVDDVTDVSALSTVHTLTLWFMPEVTDVSALSTVHTYS